MKEQASALLEEQIPKHIEDGIRHLATVSLVCKEEIFASQKAISRSLSHNIRAVEQSISEILAKEIASGRQTESRLYSAISSCHDELRIVRESLDVEAIHSNKILRPGDDEDLSKALQIIGSHLGIWHV